MSHPVDRLKELLFETESRTLSDVQQRLTKSESDLLSHSRDRQAFAERLDAVFARAGTEERFRVAVAEVLDRALRQAETDRHAELSEAVAPLIVRTICTEITNSRDELVDALYPITGRMVKAYVASAIADLANEINRRVDRNPAMLRLRSLFSGKSVAELALAEAGTLRLSDVYLIRRGTGELLAYSGSADATSDERGAVLSGVLAAINEFATDAFGADGSSLREVDLGDSRIYLRASPIYLVAARCTGAQTSDARRLLDEALLGTIERCQKGATASGPSSSTHVGELRELSNALTTRLAELPSARRRGTSPALLLLGLIAASLAGWFTWSTIDSHVVTSAKATAEAAIAATPGTIGYPIEVDVGTFARRVSLAGLTSDETVKTAILRRVANDLPGSTIVDRLTPLPGAQGAIGPAIRQAEIKSSLQRAAQRLEQVNRDLPQLTEIREDKSHAASLDETRSLVTDSLSDLRDAKSDLQTKPEEQAKLAHELRQQASELSAALAGQAHQREPASQAAALSPSESARQLEAAAETLSIVTAAALQAAALKPPPPQQIVRAPDISAQDRLALFVRGHAIFFGDSLSYRVDGEASKTLDTLAALMRDTDGLVRVVGYTDAKGTSDRNTELSDGRARKVLEELVARGVPATRLVAIGRQDAARISSGIGEESPNRRVEFELGFPGEGRQ